MSSSVTLNSAQFNTRLTHIRASLEDSQVLAIILGRRNEIPDLDANSALFLYLFSYEFPDTLLLISKERVGILTSPNKYKHIETLNTQITFFEKGESNKESYRKIRDTFSDTLYFLPSSIGGEFISGTKSFFECKSIEVTQFLVYKDSEELSLYKTVLPCIYKDFNSKFNTLLKSEYFKTVDIPKKLEELLDDKSMGFDNHLADFYRSPEVFGGNEIQYSLYFRYSGYCIEYSRMYLVNSDYEDELKYLYKKREALLEYINTHSVLTLNDLISQIGDSKINIQINCTGLYIGSVDTLQRDSTYIIRLRYSDLLLSDTIITDGNIITHEECEPFIYRGDTRPTRLKRDNYKRADLSKDRKEHQALLMEKLISENIKALKEDTTPLSTTSNESLNNMTIPYSNALSVDRNTELQLDTKNYCVNFPIKNFMVPIHISYIKNISRSDGGLRLNLKESESIKSMIYKTRRTDTLFDAIMTMKKEYQQKKDTIGVEAIPQLSGTSIGSIGSVSIRTDARLAKKLSTGNLQLFSSGLRYQSVDIPYCIIERAIHNSGSSSVHLRLKSPILFNSKKISNFQIYKVVEDKIVETSKHLSRHEERRIDSENESKREVFRREIGDLAALLKSHNVPVESVKTTSFTGVVFRSSCPIEMTEWALVSLSEAPFLYIDLKSIEIVNFERIIASLGSFDCVFIYKGLKEFTTISNIPIESLEYLRNYLDSKNIAFTETTINLKWGPLLKSINEDLLEFYTAGAWGELQEVPSESESEEESSVSEVSMVSSSGELSSMRDTSDEAGVTSESEITETWSEDEEEEYSDTE